MNNDWIKMHLIVFIVLILPINSDLIDTKVLINKCCAHYEILVDDRCTHVNDTTQTEWNPLFIGEDGKSNVQVDFRFVIGEPDCGSKQQWPILHYGNSIDQLVLLPNGKLRHYAYQHVPNAQEYDIKPTDEEHARFNDYEQGQYCMDKSLNRENNQTSQFAFVCAPETEYDWRNSDFLIRKLIDPICHGFAIVCFLFVAIVYFIMPTLRDLVGNIVTTMSVCLMVSQAADMVRIFTELSSHVSFMIADIFCYTSLLGAFFWLNSLGYYIWKTFKSRNVFLRVTDGKKYCYYSLYAWTCTIVMGVIAVFAHFTLEISKAKRASSQLHNQEVIGPLGMVIYFTPVAFTILINVFFYTSTQQIINRMNTYGRIHHKLKHSFRMFLLIFMIMTATWLFMMLSWLQYDGLVYCYIAINALQAPLYVYVCVFNQKHVSYLLRKMCCYATCICKCCRPEPECEWGDEMTAMNTGIY